MPLTKERAEYRRKVIKQHSVAYNFHVILEGTHYAGVTQIKFDLNEIPSQLAVDFQIQEVSKIIING